MADSAVPSSVTTNLTLVLIDNGNDFVTLAGGVLAVSPTVTNAAGDYVVLV